MTKPHDRSVTDVACTCNYLERAAAEPDIPIAFDAEMNEYQIAFVNNRNSATIYHCPFCGGAAPHSKRASFFATITFRESARLAELTSGMATTAQVIDKFGKPDEDLAYGTGELTHGTTTEPPTHKTYRVLYYRALSDTVDVMFTDYGPERGVRASLSGKSLGRPGK
jgi:hypothetical protein